jgi:hypothetical protein
MEDTEGQALRDGHGADGSGPVNSHMSVSVHLVVSGLDEHLDPLNGKVVQFSGMLSDITHTDQTVVALPDLPLGHTTVRC